MLTPVNALLIYPEFPDTFWSFKHALKFVWRRASLPPLGLLTVASLLPRHWRLKLVDLNVCALAEEDLRWADLVFVSAMIVQRPSVESVLERCRAAGKVVVAGGPLFTSSHAEFTTVGHFVLNEGEITLPEFLEDWGRGCAKRVYSTGQFADVSRSPSPQWGLLDMCRYGSMALQYSRGCPFDCEFCDVTAKFGHRPRVKSAAQVVGELDGLHEQGWRGSVFFVDDNLIGNKRALKEDLLPALISCRRGHRWRFSFYTEASINLADDAELMRLMADAGFESVFVGIETPSAEALVECNKRQNQGRDLVADVKRIQRAGLQVQGGFIVGFDSDGPGIFQRQVDFIQRSGIVTAMVGLLNALPGTRLHARLKGEGRLVGQTTGDNADGTMNFVPRMPAEQLVEGYRSILRRIYAPRPYYQRVRTFLREYRRPRFAPPLGWRQGLAVGWSGIRLGVLGRERFQYWRLLSWTAFHRPRLLPFAVTFAIYGHHFRKCCVAAGA